MSADGEHSKREEVIRLEAEADQLETEARDLERAAHRAEEQAHERRDRAHHIEDEERREHGEHGKGHEHHPHAILITVVVNGTGVEMAVHRDERLSEIRARALKDTQNLAQPAEAWEFRMEGSDVLDENLTVGELGLEAGVELFLSPQAGKAGA